MIDYKLPHTAIKMVKRKRTSIYIREDLIEVAKKAAAKDNRSLNNYIESLIVKDAGEETSERGARVYRHDQDEKGRRPKVGGVAD